MRTTASLTLLVLLSAFAVRAQTPTPAPIPSAILNAKTVFVSNGGSDAGLFPEPFTGDPNRAYFSFYSQLKAAGRYELVADPFQAELVMQIQLVSSKGPQHTSKQLGAADALPYFRLTIYDRKSQFLLWTITEPIEYAVLQKTHDKNFDHALSNLMADVQALSQSNSSASLYPNPPARQSDWMR